MLSGMRHCCMNVHVQSTWSSCFLGARSCSHAIRTHVCTQHRTEPVYTSTRCIAFLHSRQVPYICCSIRFSSKLHSCGLAHAAMMHSTLVQPHSGVARSPVHIKCTMQRETARSRCSQGSAVGAAIQPRHRQPVYASGIPVCFAMLSTL